MTESWTIGSRYRVTMKIPGVWNVPRVMVADLIAIETGELMFSLRPIGGTQNIETKHVVEMVEVAKTAKLSGPRKI